MIILRLFFGFVFLIAAIIFVVLELLESKKLRNIKKEQYDNYLKRYPNSNKKEYRGLRRKCLEYIKKYSPKTASFVLWIKIRLLLVLIMVLAVVLQNIYLLGGIVAVFIAIQDYTVFLRMMPMYQEQLVVIADYLKHNPENELKMKANSEENINEIVKIQKQISIFGSIVLVLVLIGFIIIAPIYK